MARESMKVLMEGVPSNIDISKLKEHISNIPNLNKMHDFHVWCLTN